MYYGSTNDKNHSLKQLFCSFLCFSSQNQENLMFRKVREIIKINKQ